MKTIAAVAVALALFVTFPSPPAEGGACLPPGVSASALASWPVVATQPMLTQDETGAVVGVVLKMYDRGSGTVMLAWVRDVAVFFDPNPDDPNVPGLLNEQMFNADKALRTAPTGPCKWRKIREGSSA
jgi:hypothetical protein